MSIHKHETNLNVIESSPQNQIEHTDYSDVDDTSPTNFKVHHLGGKKLIPLPESPAFANVQQLKNTELVPTFDHKNVNKVSVSKEF